MAVLKSFSKILSLRDYTETIDRRMTMRLEKIKVSVTFILSQVLHVKSIRMTSRLPGKSDIGDTDSLIT